MHSKDELLINSLFLAINYDDNEHLLSEKIINILFEEERSSSKFAASVSGIEQKSDDVIIKQLKKDILAKSKGFKLYQLIKDLNFFKKYNELKITEYFNQIFDNLEKGEKCDNNLIKIFPKLLDQFDSDKIMNHILYSKNTENALMQTMNAINEYIGKEGVNYWSLYNAFIGLVIYYDKIILDSSELRTSIGTLNESISNKLSNQLLMNDFEYLGPLGIRYLNGFTDFAKKCMMTCSILLANHILNGLILNLKIILFLHLKLIINVGI